MIPLRDENPVRITPVVTYTLIVINIVVFIYQLGLSRGELNSFFQVYALVPEELTANFRGYLLNQPIPEFLTLITSQFLHGSLLHVGFNMLSLWIFGNNIEEALGHIKYLIFYLTCGILAALAQWFFSMNSPIPSLGASGAIAGVMGAYILKFPRAKILTLVPIFFFLTTFRVPAIYFLGFWFFMQAFNGIGSLGTMQSGGIAYWAHIGGFVAGMILAPILGLFGDRDR
jgi:membrane associated rhomboid family serine protease